MIAQTKAGRAESDPVGCPTPLAAPWPASPAPATRSEVAEIVLEAAQKILPLEGEPQLPFVVGSDLRIDLPPRPPRLTAELLLTSLIQAAGLALECISLLDCLGEAATTDPLTRLPNRRAPLEAAPRIIA